MAAHLMETEGVIRCGDRTVLPANQCQQALNVLHAGHAGVTTMLTKATQSLFWPGLRQDIINIKAQCQDCMYMLPSNPAPPPQAPMEPDFPFSHLCMDLFQVEATYLVSTLPGGDMPRRSPPTVPASSAPKPWRHSYAAGESHTGSPRHTTQGPTREQSSQSRPLRGSSQATWDPAAPSTPISSPKISWSTVTLLTLSTVSARP